MVDNPPPIPIEGNNHRDDRNDIMPNNDAFREHNGNMEIENIILNGDAFERNNHLEDENDHIPNDFNEDGREDEGENEEEGEYEDDIKSLNGDWGNAYFDHNEDEDEEEDEDRNENENEDEDEDDIVSYDTFSDLDENENADENYRQLRRVRLNPPKLEHIKNVLYVGLNQFFKEIEIEVVRCPCLTEPPFNLAAEGLSGKTLSWEVGNENNFVPVPQTNMTYNIPLLLINQNFVPLLYNKFFVIGAGYAAKPSMPFNGHLTINATVSHFHVNINNNSCIVYEEANTKRRKLITIDKSNQMICSMLGNFFISEGRLGKVIKVRAKGRIGNYDIISLIQRRLGGVLLMDGGRVLQHITSENYPERMNSYVDFYTWPNCYELNCMDLLAVGTIGNTPFVELRMPNEPFLIGSRFKFNAFSNYEAAGQFINDVTPNDTEYIGYFNVAQHSLSSI